MSHPMQTGDLCEIVKPESACAELLGFVSSYPCKAGRGVS